MNIVLLRSCTPINWRTLPSVSIPCSGLIFIGHWTKVFINIILILLLAAAAAAAAVVVVVVVFVLLLLLLLLFLTLSDLMWVVDFLQPNQVQCICWYVYHILMCPCVYCIVNSSVCWQCWLQVCVLPCLCVADWLEQYYEGVLISP